MGIVADVEITFDLLNARITKWRRGLFVFHGNTEAVIRKRGML